MSECQTNWDDVRIFLALARSEKLNSAAQSINLDPTTVMRRLARMSRALNVSLFEHETSGYVLTACGREMLEHAEAAESAIIALRERATATATQGIAGNIRVSVDEGFGSWVIARGLPKFQRRFPNVDVDLVATSTYFNPSKREVDIAIAIERPESGSLTVRKLTEFTIRLYASREYIAQHGVVLSINDLSDHKFIGYIPDMVYSSELKFLEEVMPNVEPTIRSASINAQYTLTVSGLGIGVLPSFIADQDPRIVAILPDELTIRRHLWIIGREDMRGTPRFKAFNDWLSGLVRERRRLLMGEKLQPEYQEGQMVGNGPWHELDSIERTTARVIADRSIDRPKIQPA